MAKGIFITGTGTDVGKTYVTGLLVKKLREGGLNAGYYKAALSGGEIQNGTPVAGDARHVCEAAGLREEEAALVSYIYKEPVSPHLAAQIEKKPIEMDKLIADFNRIKSRFDYVTVEGSGGIVCPLRLDEEKIMLTDVIKAFSLDVIIVAPSGLGSINSTVLTASYAKNLGIHVKGIVLNQYEQGNFLHEDNQKQIEFLTGVPVIAHIPCQGTDCGMDVLVLSKLYGEV